MLVRIQKHIADMGICSRRKAEEFISAGKVKLNGKTVTEMGVKIDPQKDKVEVAGYERSKKSFDKSGANKIPKNIYIILNKPVDFITSTTSEQGQSVIDLLRKENGTGHQRRDVRERVYPVGRLDKDSEGLVLLTNDGELANKLTHPRYEHEKEYEVVIDQQLSRDARKVLEKGMNIEDGFVQGIKIKKEFNKGKRTIITVILKEGKNRQIRKMFGRLGYKVLALKRTRLGRLKLGVLPVGRWKFVKKEYII